LWRLCAVSTRITVNDFRACSSEIDKKGKNSLGVGLAGFVRGDWRANCPEIREIVVFLIGLTFCLEDYKLHIYTVE
jgi:hypothetical protein